MMCAHGIDASGMRPVCGELAGAELSASGQQRLSCVATHASVMYLHRYLTAG